MTVEAVIQYWQHAGADRESSAESAAVVAHAGEAGFRFTAGELETVRSVSRLLAHAHRDAALRAHLLSATAPSSVLAEIAPDLGYPLDRVALVAVLRAYHECRGELDARALDQVAGGTGARFAPEVEDEVLVHFLQGDASRPIIVGSLWGGNDKPPS